MTLKATFAIAFISIGTIITNAANYKITAHLTEDENGLTAYIINYDTKQKVDSVIVENDQAVFSGNADAPFFAQLVIDGDRYGSFIVEEGEITIKNKQGFGSTLNESLNSFNQKVRSLQKNFQEASNDSVRQEIYNGYLKDMSKLMVENVNNPLGLYLFLQQMYEMNMEQVNSALEEYPQFKTSTRVKNYIVALKQKELTSPGKKYIDFEVTYDGKTSKLSDYVKPGQYTIVDFWASWCGPCMRQAIVLKEIYTEYKDNGLEIVGVAVWDEPNNTLNAIKSKELPWHNILNAQTIPTDLYGISGIPCIIIIGPDGTILSRDKQGDELKADVRKALSGELK